MFLSQKEKESWKCSKRKSFKFWLQPMWPQEDLILRKSDWLYRLGLLKTCLPTFIGLAEQEDAIRQESQFWFWASERWESWRKSKIIQRSSLSNMEIMQRVIIKVILLQICKEESLMTESLITETQTKGSLLKATRNSIKEVIRARVNFRAHHLAQSYIYQGCQAT